MDNIPEKYLRGTPVKKREIYQYKDGKIITKTTYKPNYGLREVAVKPYLWPGPTVQAEKS
jgi:hypothetical protein